jgi:hypothetical protein
LVGELTALVKEETLGATLSSWTAQETTVLVFPTLSTAMTRTVVVPWAATLIGAL